MPSTTQTTATKQDNEFNRKKLQVAKIEATLARHLLPGEITHELFELAEEHVKSVPKAVPVHPKPLHRADGHCQ